MKEVEVRFIRYLPDIIVLAFVVLGQALAAAWIVHHPLSGARPRTRFAFLAATSISIAAVFLGFLLRFARVAKYFSDWWPSWGRGLVITWILLSFTWLGVFALLRVFAAMGVRIRPAHSPARRNFLKTAHATLFAAPAVTVGYGMFVQRNQLSLREQKIEIPSLPPELDGLRLVQLTDIHLSPFLTRAELERAVAMANETRAHVALVTGDLITTGRDPLDDCLKILAGLRAEAGIFGCLGNHEVYAGVEDHAEREGARVGLRFLRNSAAQLTFGGSVLNLAGVDYQRAHAPYLVGAEKLIIPAAFNVLLSHNPDVFPVAARQGYPLTISGHTHGGQVRVEILHADLNVARFYTPYVDGVYRQDDASVFVSRGIGTIGIPARIGAPPEVALIHLCRT
jgi:predicted MPP superfamily phosphohydrolase